jgi:hypothetical protein
VKSAPLRVVLWCISLAVLALTVVECREDWADVRLPLPTSSRTTMRITLARPESLETAAALLVKHDPFRLDRHPSTTPFRAELAVITPPAAPVKPPHPALLLAGVVGGPPWEALLDGVPGHDASTLVKKGDVLGDLKIRSIERDTVVVQGADTIWRLVMKHPWP